jgi:hypothetical protein
LAGGCDQASDALSLELSALDGDDDFVVETTIAVRPEPDVDWLPALRLLRLVDAAAAAGRTKSYTPRIRGNGLASGSARNDGAHVEPTSGLEPLTCSLRDPEDPEE